MTSQNFWCAWCGKYGDHQSGWCPDIKRQKEEFYLKIKFQRHKDKLSGAAGDLNNNKLCGF